VCSRGSESLRIEKEIVEMSIRPDTESGHQRDVPVTQSEAGSTEVRTPRKPTFIQNAIMTVKILAGFGLLGATLWAINLWTAPN
jgi:hypothetical protein